MRPISKQFQKLRFTVGGYAPNEDILWVWWEKGERIVYGSYHGFRRIEAENRFLEREFESGKITFTDFVSKVKSPIAEDPAAATTVANCAASQLKSHQIFALWEALSIHTFQSEYSDHSVCDGTQWELMYESDGKSYSIEGSNEFPDQWSALIDFLILFDPQFDEMRNYNDLYGMFQGVPWNVRNFARKHGYCDARRMDDWNDYEVYALSEAPFDSGADLCAFALARGKGCRLSTPEESMGLMKR